MNTALWIVQVVLAVTFILAGLFKTLQYERAKESMAWVGDVPKGLVTFIGISEMLGGLGLVLPILTNILPWLTPLAAIGLAIIMVLAIIFHLRRGEGKESIIDFVLLPLALFVIYGRWDLLLF